MDSLPFYLAALVVLLAVSAFFSGSEAALFSLTRTDLDRLGRQQRGPGREVVGLLGAPRAILVTILIGNLLVNVAATSAATAILVGIFGESGVAIAFVMMSTVILIAGEILPKAVAVHMPVRFALIAAYPLRVFHAVFYPARAPITAFTDRVIDVLKVRLGKAREHFSQDELITAFDVVEPGDARQGFAYDLLRNIIEFRDTVVKEIMTPSIEVFSLPISMSPEEMEDQLLRSNHSRAPVYGDTADDIIGILHIKDLAPVAGGEFDLKRVLREPHYVPESTRIAALFRQMGEKRLQMALVIDEHGSFAGLVTIEDILEELVGEIRDEKEALRADHHLLSDGRIVVDGAIEIEVFNDIYGANIDDSENETIAGHVLAATGRIPHEGESIDIGNLRFHILSAQKHRIRKMRVERR